MSKAYEFVLLELARTPELLAVLKENKVVDAGAKVIIISAMGQENIIKEMMKKISTVFCIYFAK